MPRTLDNFLPLPYLQVDCEEVKSRALGAGATDSIKPLGSMKECNPLCFQADEFQHSPFEKQLHTY